MSETLEQKALRSGARLYLISYQLGSEVAGRPAGTTEFIFGLWSKKGYQSTMPTASWYLTKEQYLKLHHAIRRERDFEIVREFLFDVQSEEDAAKIEDVLEELAKR